MEHVESHSESEIVKGCIGLMSEMVGRFESYLDFMGIEPAPDGDEQHFCTDFTYGHIVGRLLLWKTTHSGGTSTAEKCAELGFDYYDSVVFEDERGKEEEDA